MTKELTTKEETNLAPVTEGEIYGACEDISAGDIQIPELKLIQSNANEVNEGARPGAWINKLSFEEIGYKAEQEAEVILIKSERYWWEKEAGENGKFIGRRPGTCPTELPWNDCAPDGRPITRTYVHAFYVLLPSEIEGGDDLPLEVRFKSTGMAAARQINAFLMKLRKKQKASWSVVFKLSTLLNTKDNKTWWLPKVAVGRETTAKEVEAATNWYKLLTSSANITHLEDEESYKTNNKNDGYVYSGESAYIEPDAQF